MILSIDIDECVGSPCKNGATCQNTPGSHKCNCKPGFTGKDCGKGELYQNGYLSSTSYLLHFFEITRRTNDTYLVTSAIGKGACYYQHHSRHLSKP